MLGKKRSRFPIGNQSECLPFVYHQAISISTPEYFSHTSSSSNQSKPIHLKEPLALRIYSGLFLSTMISNACKLSHLPNHKLRLILNIFDSSCFHKHYLFSVDCALKLIYKLVIPFNYLKWDHWRRLKA